jgi:NUMOD3 motif
MLCNFYTYIYLNPLKSGNYTYKGFVTFFYEPFYVGKGFGNRIYKHLKETEEGTDNLHKYRTIQKIRRSGKEPIVIKITENLDEKCAHCFEKFLIKLIGRDDLDLGPLLNLTDGGEGSVNMSEEVKKRIGKIQRGRVHTKEHKQKNRESQLGRIPSEETRKKRSKSLKGKKYTYEHRQKIREGLKGKCVGEKNPMFGKKHTEETRKKQSEVKRGKKQTVETREKKSKIKLEYYRLKREEKVCSV